MELREYLQDLVNESYENLVACACDALVNLLDRLNQLGFNEEENSSFVVLLYIASSIASDGKITELEKKFLKDVIKISDEQIDILFNLGSDPELVQTLDNIFDLHDNEVCVNVLMIVSCLVAIDETINRDEIAFIEKLLEY